MPRLQNLLIYLFLIILATGCGYYNPYVVNKDAESISLHRSMWKNRTGELGLEHTFYRSLSNWLRKTKFIHLKEQADQAQYVLTGQISSVDFPELSYSGNNVASELRAILTVDFDLVEQSTGKSIWKRKAVYSETFHYETNSSTLLANKKAALEEIADDVSEEIYLYIINKVISK